MVISSSKQKVGPRITNVITLYRYPGDPLPFVFLQRKGYTGVVISAAVLVNSGKKAEYTAESLLAFSGLACVDCTCRRVDHDSVDGMLTPFG